MTYNTQTAIPQAMRELAAKNIDQARAAYNQLMDSAQKAQEAITALIPANPALQGLIQTQERVMKFTRQNVDAGFSLADEHDQCGDLPRKFCKFRAGTLSPQIEAYSRQAKEFAARDERSHPKSSAMAG